MRILGRLLTLLGILCLIGGAGLAGYVALETKPFIDDAIDKKDKAMEEFEGFDGFIDDAEIMRQRAIRIMEDYERGRITDPNNSRVMSFLADARDLAEKSDDLSEEIGEYVEDIRDAADSLQQRADGLIRLAAAGLILMILSGWIFSLGLLCLRKTSQ